MDKPPNSFDVKIKDQMIIISFSYDEQDFYFTLPLGKAVGLFRLLNSRIKKLMEEYDVET